MKKTTLFIILLFLIITACATMPASPASVSRAVEIIASATPSSTSEATAVPIVVTATSSPLLCRATAPAPTEKCIAIEQNVPDDLSLSGVWVINPGSPRLRNLDEKTFYGVPLEGGGLLSSYSGDMAISPSGQHVAYIDTYLSAGMPTRTEKRVLRVMRSSGHSLDMSYWKEEWQWLIGWVDDQNLALYTSKKEVVILNPLSGAWRVFEQPEWLTKEDESSYYGYYRDLPGYSPNLEWVVQQSSNKVSLRNVQTGETTWQINGDPWARWAWSADNKTVVIISEKWAYRVRNGNQVGQFNMSKFNYSYSYEPALSPDGSKLAFNAYKTDDYRSRLVILDMETKKFSSLCDDLTSGWRNAPSWSPDGRFVVMNAHNSDYEAFDVLVDAQEMKAYLFETNFLKGQVAWLAKP